MALIGGCVLDREGGLLVPGEQGGQGGAGQGGIFTDGGGGSGNTGNTGNMGGAPAENCLDSEDNDGDGDADCADSDCGAFECVATIPAGWVPVRAAHKPYADAPPDCPQGGAPTILASNPDMDAQCTPCTCDAISGVTCSPPGIECFVAMDCNGTAAFTETPVLDVCTEVPDTFTGGGAAKRCRMTNTPSLPLTTGACPPLGGQLADGSPFAEQHDLCQVPDIGAGCPGEGACVETLSGDYADVCIQQGGDVDCPSTWPNKIEAFTGGDDQRSCDTCTCDPVPACTNPRLELADDDACGAGFTINNTNCTQVTNTLDDNTGSYTARVDEGGGCTPLGGGGIGSVLGMGPQTLCCR
jgi:hypothetical protein